MSWLNYYVIFLTNILKKVGRRQQKREKLPSMQSNNDVNRKLPDNLFVIIRKENTLLVSVGGWIIVFHMLLPIIWTYYYYTMFTNALSRLTE